MKMIYIIHNDRIEDVTKFTINEYPKYYKWHGKFGQTEIAIPPNVFSTKKEALEKLYAETSDTLAYCQKELNSLEGEL